MGGSITSETSEVTTLENAAPMIRPKATSITLSRPKNAVMEVSITIKQTGSNTGKIAPEPCCTSPNALSSLDQRVMDIIVDVVHRVWIATTNLGQGAA